MNFASELTSVILACIALMFVIALIYTNIFNNNIFKVGTIIGIIALGMFAYGFWRTREE